MVSGFNGSAGDPRAIALSRLGVPVKTKEAAQRLSAKPLRAE
jgi:hypothetical protein